MWKSSLIVLVAFMAGCAADAAAIPEPAGSADSPASEGKGKADAPATTTTTATADDTSKTYPNDPTDPTAPAPTEPPAAPAKPTAASWYKDGATTGTGSANDLGALKVDADTVTVAQLANLMETSKYNGDARAKDKPADFDEIFLTRATNAAFMTKMAKATTKVIADGYPQVIVYSNGPRCIAQAPKGSWGAIAKAGAMIGLEAYTTTMSADIKTFTDAHPFKDTADLAASILANAELYAAFEARLTTYVADTKTQLGNEPALFDHITLLQYEKMSHDIERFQSGGRTADEATHLAELWYAAMKSVAAKESIHWGIWHPA